MHFSNLISRRPKGISFLFYPPPSIPSKYPRAFFYPIPQVFFVVCAVESRRRHPTYFRLDFCSVESYSKKNQTFLNPHDFEYFSLYIYIVSQFFFVKINFYMKKCFLFYSDLHTHAGDDRTTFNVYGEHPDEKRVNSPIFCRRVCFPSQIIINWKLPELFLLHVKLIDFYSSGVLTIPLISQLSDLSFVFIDY